jgi:glycosyltransferase involved in cell wall biosynthesis
MEEKTPLRILILADGRSPIIHRWVAMLAPLQYHISLVSSYPCDPVAGVDSFYILPLAFSTLGGSQAGGSAHANILTNLVKRFRPLAQKARTRLGPWTLGLKKNRLRQIITLDQPDIIHAFRIPFEGMLAGLANANLPMVISTWGNDFTLHAPATRQMGKLTRNALRGATALLSDTQIDIKRAASWGFDSQKPSLVVPGNGGINLADMLEASAGVIKNEPFRILNPRGLRSYVHSDTFFKAIPLVLKEIPDAIFSCTSMQGQTEAEMWVHRLGIEKNVDLLPLLTQKELWREFARSHVSVSVSSHDGTPNTLLEAMASGCLPICGDLPSIREWITSGENGLLVNPLDPAQLSESILLSLRNPEFLQKAARMNLQLISQHADIETVRRSTSDFYALVHSKGVK